VSCHWAAKWPAVSRVGWGQKVRLGDLRDLMAGSAGGVADARVAASNRGLIALLLDIGQCCLPQQSHNPALPMKST
jgi:hypothetical protein